MRNLDLLKRYLDKNDNTDFDSYGGLIRTDYGVEYYISLNSLELEYDESQEYSTEGKITAFSQNPFLALASMMYLLNKSEDEFNIEEDEDNIYEVSERNPEGHELIGGCTNLIELMFTGEDQIKLVSRSLSENFLKSVEMGSDKVRYSVLLNRLKKLNKIE